MKEKIYSKINNDNKKIVEELIDTIEVWELDSLEDLKKFQEKLFKLDGKYMNDEEKINYCIKLINSSHYWSENLDFWEARDLADMEYHLNNDNCSEIEKEILIIKIMSLVDYEMMLPYTAYKLILDDKI